LLGGGSELHTQGAGGGGKEGVTCVEDEKIIEALSTIPSSEDVETTGAGCEQKRKQGEVLRSTDLCTRALL
jgi:hypothetical protein